MIMALFVFWTFIDALLAERWRQLTEQGKYPRWLDWLQAKAHRQRWKAEKRLERLKM